MMSGTEKQFSLTRAALSTGGRAKSKFLSVSVENSKTFPIDGRALVGQDGTTMNESQKQFSFTRGALSTCERRKSNYLIQERIAS
jgi:hypothetical protein